MNPMRSMLPVVTHRWSHTPNPRTFISEIWKEPSEATRSTYATCPTHDPHITAMAPTTGVCPSGRPNARALRYQVQASPLQGTTRRVDTYQVHCPQGNLSLDGPPPCQYCAKGTAGWSSALGVTQRD